MPPQARVGDMAFVPADAHGCPGCPHPSIGPAIQGSQNVLTNGLPSVRVGDPGIHAACCGPNTWNAKVGSSSVLINGRKAHRLGDLTKHCGGLGSTVHGSPNVIVGDNGRVSYGAPRSNDLAVSKDEHTFVEIELVDQDSRPVARARYVVTASDSTCYEGRLGEDGMARIDGIVPGTCQVVFPEFDDVKRAGPGL